MPRLLLVLPQLPHDPGSGAARSVRGAAELVAAASDWTVRALATTGIDADANAGSDWARLFLRRGGIEPTVEEGTAPGERMTWRFRDRGIDYRLLDIGAQAPMLWDADCQRQFDRLYDDTLDAWCPDVILTYGGGPEDLARQQRARAAGIRQVAGVRNHSYYLRDFFEPFQAVLTPSEFLADRYRTQVGVESVALPTPIDPGDVSVPAAERAPIFFTTVNPMPLKGSMFLARLAEELGTRRPDIPLLVIESRGTAGELVRAGMAGGFDLQRHGTLMFSPAVPQPRDFLASARALLVPSVFAEPSARVVAEALYNGVPPLVSDRGGILESCLGAGFVLPLPTTLTPETRVPVGPEAVAGWLEVIERLADDEAFYQAASARAAEAGRAYRPEVLGPRYVAFFEGVLAAPARASVLRPV